MTSVQIQIPFESLIEAITSLDLEKKHQLLEIIEDLVFEAEEEATEQNLQVIEEVKEARKAYQNGDYQTIEEYIKCQSQ
ncbi:MAG: hypothetical protein ACFCU5_03300 [Pleurocapsa sp.]